MTDFSQFLPSTFPPSELAASFFCLFRGKAGIQGNPLSLFLMTLFACARRPFDALSTAGRGVLFPVALLPEVREVHERAFRH